MELCGKKQLMFIDKINYETNFLIKSGTNCFGLILIKGVCLHFIINIHRFFLSITDITDSKNYYIINKKAVIFIMTFP